MESNLKRVKNLMRGGNSYDKQLVSEVQKKYKFMDICRILLMTDKESEEYQEFMNYVQECKNNIK